MKTISAIAVVVAMDACLLVGAPMTQRDRENLVSHLQMTESWLADEVSTLSAPQLNFRMAPGKWTVAEVVEHLVIADPTYWQLFQDGMKAPAKRLEKQATDADVLWYGINRTQHQKTEPRKDPKDKAIDIREALDSFRKLHSMMLDYARTTNDDLRRHAVQDWGVDAYQCLLEISTHTQRHILQIREIKADPGFPKK
ncbi:MAG: DinB family protein [Bryobacteraceae bacterium]